jgi:hypothetical protein
MSMPRAATSVQIRKRTSPSLNACTAQHILRLGGWRTRVLFFCLGLHACWALQNARAHTAAVFLRTRLHCACTRQCNRGRSVCSFVQTCMAPSAAHLAATSTYPSFRVKNLTEATVLYAQATNACTKVGSAGRGKGASPQLCAKCSLATRLGPNCTSGSDDMTDL